MKAFFFNAEPLVRYIGNLISQFVYGDGCFVLLLKFFYGFEWKALEDCAGLILQIPYYEVCAGVFCEEVVDKGRGCKAVPLGGAVHERLSVPVCFSIEPDDVGQRFIEIVETGTGILYGVEL
jgi:hypothetical protein